MNILDGLYILDENHKPIAPTSLEQWSKWRKDDNNVQVALSTFSWGRVSTIFLGKDYSNLLNLEPQLFETMVFGGEYNGKSGDIQIGSKLLTDIKKFVRGC